MSARLIRLRVAMLAVFVVASAPLGAQNHDFTTFVPGLGAPKEWWTRQNTIGRLGQQVNLRTPLNPDVGTLGAVSSQSSTIQGVMVGNGGRHALVGHSMGGIVVRRAAAAAPNNTPSILTIGTPHRGAPVADNLQPLLNYIVSTTTTMAVGIAWALGPTAGSWVSALKVIYTDNIQRSVNANAPIGQPAVLDARTFSSVVTTNKTSLDNFPHATVYGELDRRFAWMRVASSALYGHTGPVGGWESKYKHATNVLRVCQVVRFFMVLSPRGHMCRRGYKAATAFDERWQAFTAGGNVPSDGWIPNSSSIYPGTTASQALNLKVSGVDHNALITDQRGINGMANQMTFQLGLPRP